MNRYSEAGLTAATAASVDNAAAGLWNGSSSKRIYVYEVYIAHTVAPAAVCIPTIRRVSARGTVTTSYTPDITDDVEHGLAPESGLTLDLAYSAQPTFIAGASARGLEQFATPASIGAAVMWSFARPIAVKAGQGIVISSGNGTAITVSSVTFTHEE